MSRITIKILKAKDAQFYYTINKGGNVTSTSETYTRASTARSAARSIARDFRETPTLIDYSRKKEGIVIAAIPIKL